MKKCSCVRKLQYSLREPRPTAIREGYGLKRYVPTVGTAGKASHVGVVYTCSLQGVLLSCLFLLIVQDVQISSLQNLFWRLEIINLFLHRYREHCSVF